MAYILEKDTDQTVMQARQLAAQAYSTYVQMGALLPEEIRQSQFGGAEYSFEINLDDKLWDKKQKEQEEQAQQAQQAQYGGDDDQGQGDQGQYGQQQDYGGDEAQYDSLVTDSELYDRAISETKNRYQVSDTPYAKKYALRRYKQLYKDSHNTLSGAFKVVQKDSRDEPWVRIGDEGQVVGLCRLDGDRSSCLPQSRAEAMSADERKLFIQRKKNHG